MQNSMMREYLTSLQDEQSIQSTHLTAVLSGCSQYTFDAHSNACSAISMAVCYAFMSLQDTFIVLMPDFSAVAAFDAAALRHALMVGNEVWDTILKDGAHKFQTNQVAEHPFLTPHQILTSTKKANIKYAEHYTICGNTSQLREIGMKSLYEIIKQFSDDANTTDSPTSAAFVCRGSTVALLFPSKKTRASCIAAPNWCAIADSHPRSGATISVFKSPDELTTWLLRRSIGLDDAGITSEQLFSSSVQIELVVQKTHSAARETAPTIQASENSVLTGKSYTQAQKIMNHSIAKNTPGNQVDLMELSLTRM
jgi:hypothetical protein